MEDKRAMIIAPHPDDEINLAGQILPYLQDNDYKIYVVYTTNGDSEVKIGNKRLVEAIESCEVLGIPRENVLFLGYANEWERNTHIYDESSCLISAIGKKQTNSIESHPEYCFMKHGIHHEFTQINFKNDLKELIYDYRPSLIICVDFDSHPDHRAASLTFETIIGEMLKEDANYRPMILKKFAYNGVWKGEKDYYPSPCKKTKMDISFTYGGEIHDVECPGYLWEDRITFNSAPQTTTPLLMRNILYKAASKHKQTVAWYQMQRVLNGDSIYWERRTDNLLFNEVKINSSSGNHKYINDFLTFNVDRVCTKELVCNDNEYCWRPDINDDRKRLSITFDSEITLQDINIYEDFSKTNHIKKLQIIIGELCCYIEPNSNGSKTNLHFDDGVLTDNIIIRIIEWNGIPGISEIEVYDKKVSGFDFYGNEVKNRYINKWEMIAQKVERAWLMLRFMFVFKIAYEFNRMRRGKELK